MVHQFLIEMGQNASLHKGRRKSQRSLKKCSLKSKNSLSHTFAVFENDDGIDLLNINSATEEEIMTLPGINRDVAKNVVEHRKVIGRFRKVEDLALVPGIGARKLELLRPEICVISKKNLSCSSSRAPSYDSLRSNDSISTVKSSKLININKANVFELQSIYGISQEIAASIVHLRSKKGNFKKVEDLLRVKGMDRIRLSNIARFLTVESIDVDEPESEDGPRPSILTNGYTMPYYQRCNRGPLKLPMSNGLNPSTLIDVFELLSAYSPRPTLRETFKFCKNGEPAIRIGSWNLHDFSLDKINNLGVKEVVCRTILEQGLSIIAVQDVTNVLALRAICNELNKPQLRRVEEWKDKFVHNWNFCMLDIHDSKLGYIYDCDGAANIELLSLSEGGKETKNECELLIANFQVNSFDLQLLNLRLHDNSNEILLSRKFKEFFNDKDMVMVLSNFSEVTQFSEKYLTLADLNPIFPDNKNTNYVINKSMVTRHQISNILCNDKMSKQLTGEKNIVRKGLTHLAIPNGWSWGGAVSPYCPVWTELYLNLKTNATSMNL